MSKQLSMISARPAYGHSIDCQCEYCNEKEDRALNWEQSLTGMKDGVKKAENLDKAWVHEMREKARAIARERGTVCMDDVRAIAHRSPTSPKVWGAVLHHRDFVRIGDKCGAHPSNHASRIGIYRLRGEEDGA